MPPLPPPPPGTLRVAAGTDTADGLNAPVSARFARTPFLTIVDIVDGRATRVEPMPNAFASGAGGVGAAVGQWLLSSGVSVVVAPSLGPNISMILGQAGVRVEVVPPGVPLGEALKRLGLLR
ncbi:conserved hypothetical protein [Thermofilum pendens Hrk 5]|uniref:Dinitrogenase iron-molybdenum cofactor biosynthesis domain-containing protein n=2 Tax=Thermofilum pendens TaxID=2269 RepID=A1RYW5_THEPD|nr:conserved hypothetical protein [Thermofilum pendens Hrk 5]